MSLHELNDDSSIKHHQHNIKHNHDSHDDCCSVGEHDYDSHDDCCSDEHHHHHNHSHSGGCACCSGEGILSDIDKEEETSKRPYYTIAFGIIIFILAYFIGDGVLKELIGRIRPCNVDTPVPLIVKRSTSYSCPSVHSMLAFSSAVSVFMNYKRTGIFTLVFAGLIGFSRLYFFVHYPTDVIFSAVLGTIIGCCVCRLTAK